mgnify:CR=1 FL=1
MKKTIPSEFQAAAANQGAIGKRANGQITWRGLLLGGLLCVVIALGVPYTTMVLQATPMGVSSSSPAAFCLLFFVLTLGHGGLALLKRRWGLQWGELVTITIMMMVAAAIPTRGVTGMLLPMISGTFYYASAENNWAREIHPHLADWMMMGEPVAVRGFYEGSEGTTLIPWASWLAPLLYWLVFYAAFYLTLVSIGVIMRRRWVEHERLAFPIAQVPLAMIEDGGGKGIIKPFFRSRVMWCGFAVPFIVGNVNALANYFPSVVRLVLSTKIEIIDQGISLTVAVNFLMLGFAFLISSTLSLSLWFFYLLFEVQDYFLGVVGLGGREAVLGPWSTAVTGHQMTGALAVLVCSGIWMGREHIKGVWNKALGQDPEVDDSDEIMPYRWAILGLLGGSALMVLWLWQSGIPILGAAFLVGIALIIFLGLTRGVIEAGIPIISPGIVPAGFLVSAVGVPALGTRGMIATAHTLIWAGELMVFMMAPLANGLRLTSEATGHRRRLLLAIAAAMLITLVVSTCYMLYLSYSYGGVNLHRQFFGESFPTYPSNFAQQKLANPSGASMSGWIWTVGGGLGMMVLMGARQRFAWWPFHPLGFAMAPGWTMAPIWFSIFLAWLIKVSILKFGGARLYYKARPFFLGLLGGQFATAGIWLVVDSFTGKVGNIIPMVY